MSQNHWIPVRFVLFHRCSGRTPSQEGTGIRMVASRLWGLYKHGGFVKISMANCLRSVAKITYVS